MSTSFIIGLCGGSASGKTSAALLIKKNIEIRIKKKNNIKIDIPIINMDNYYKQFTNNNNNDKNFDTPNAIDLDLFYHHLLKIKKGYNILIPKYNFINHTREESCIRIKNTKIIIVEGIFLFYDKRILDLLSYKIYLDIYPFKRLYRRILRDYQSRNRTLKDILIQYFKYVHPMHYKYIEPLKKKSDIIIKNNKLDFNIFNDIINKN